MEFAGMPKPNIASTDFNLDKESDVLIVDNGQQQHYRTLYLV